MMLCCKDCLLLVSEGWLDSRVDANLVRKLSLVVRRSKDGLLWIYLSVRLVFSLTALVSLSSMLLLCLISISWEKPFLAPRVESSFKDDFLSSDGV
jgi:hypothetical protein